MLSRHKDVLLAKSLSVILSLFSVDCPVYPIFEVLQWFSQEYIKVVKTTLRISTETPLSLIEGIDFLRKSMYIDSEAATYWFSVCNRDDLSRFHSLQFFFAFLMRTSVVMWASCNFFLLGSFESEISSADNISLLYRVSIRLSTEHFISILNS